MGKEKMFDVVYPLKESEPNEDLRYSLRSLEKYGGEIGRVFLVGYCPSWIKNVIHIPTEQCGDKHISTRDNIQAVCECDLISEEFILMNDDFILTKEVKNWRDFTNVCAGTLLEKHEQLTAEKRLYSPWLQGFEFNRKLLLKLGVQGEPLNYEIHHPMLQKRHLRGTWHSISELQPYLMISDPVLFNRSIYGNLFLDGKAKKIKDNKLFSDVQDYSRLLQNGAFSVDDNLIGNEDCPRLNAWLKKEFPYLSRFEKIVY